MTGSLIMPSQLTGIPVLTARHLDPGLGRVETTMPEGMTVAEIVAAALPGASPSELVRCRVALVNASGATIVLPERWHQVRPKSGVRVVIRLIPGKNALKAVLSIVISIAAVAIGGWLAGAGWLGLVPGTAGYAIASAGIALGINLVGSLLLNALIPPVKPDNERKNTYSISGWRNRLEPDGAVPVILGQIRYAPPFGAMSYTEIVGDWQYIRALFVFGEGPLALTDFRIGETSLSEFSNVDIEVRTGLPGDLPSSLFPRQVVEEAIGVELTRPLPRDELGEIISGEPAEESPVVRTTGADAAGASVIIYFPGGLVQFDDEGRKRNRTVGVRIEQRLVTAEEWQLVTTLEITARKAESFYRQHTWDFPTRGRWQVRMIMLTDETDDSKVQQRTAWAALQTLRPEYPLAFNRPLALVAVRIKATHQLNGNLDNFSALVSRICPDWDRTTGTWITRATSNPASLFRFVSQMEGNARALSDSGINLELLQDWHEFCENKGLHYNRVLDQTGVTLGEVCSEISVAGRASPQHDGRRLGVVIDRPTDLIIDHVNPRNSWNFTMRRSYTELPHAFITKFQDQDNDFKEAERVIRRPGYEGDITITETLDQPGLTYAPVVYREGLRRFLEAMYRPDSFEITQDGSLHVATRGDKVALSHDALSRVQMVGRVRYIAGRLIEMDETVTMETGKNYGLRFRVYEDAEDTIGTSVVRDVITAPGSTSVLMLAGDGPLPERRDLVHFGLLGSDSFELMVTAIEATEDGCTILRAVEAAPNIDAETDAAEIPEWSSRVGVELDPNMLQPSAPRFTRIASGIVGSGATGLIEYLLEPGAGTVTATSYEVEHRLGTSGDWTTVTIPAANGGGTIEAYTQGATVQMRVRALSGAGVASAWSAVVTLVVGAGDAAIPAALDDDAISITTLLGGVLIQVATGTDVNTAQIQIYRSSSPVLDRETDAAGEPYAVSPVQSYSMALGDTTRSNLLAGGAMNDAGAWTLDAGWAIASGVATHTAGAADAISQPLTATAGKFYRLGFDISGRTVGSLMPQLSGGSLRLGISRSVNGNFADRIQAVTGNDTIAWAADASFDGALDNAVAYVESAASLSQGTHYLFIEPRNVDGVPGPVSGPFEVSII
jgi:hypothetical protein